MQYPDNADDWYFFVSRAVAWTDETLKKEWAEKSEEPFDGYYFARKSDKYVGGHKHYQTSRFSEVYICIGQVTNQQTHINLGCADLARKDFPEKWRELVAAAKDRVDRLNSVAAALEIHEGGSCAECGGKCAEGDYLCEACRT